MRDEFSAEICTCLTATGVNRQVKDWGRVTSCSSKAAVNLKTFLKRAKSRNATFI